LDYYYRHTLLLYDDFRDVFYDYLHHSDLPLLPDLPLPLLELVVPLLELVVPLLELVHLH
jgi:hypothetical protein